MIQTEQSTIEHEEEKTAAVPQVLFYASCAAVSLGAGMTAMGFLVFGSEKTEDLGIFLKVVGIPLCVAGVVGAFVFLGKARK